MKKYGIISLIMLLILCGCANNEPLSRTQILLDTQVTITLYDQPSSNILDECFEICKKYELLLSRTNPESELYKLNHQDKNESIRISDELAKVIQIGLDYSEMSNGNFDITVGRLIDLWDFKATQPVVPKQSDIAQALTTVSYKNINLDNNIISFSNPDTIIDLGAVAKGYIGDQIKDYLVKQGINSAIINLGGNVLCVGKKGTDDFRIGITDPQGNDDIIRLNIDDLSVVTSGIYQRYFEADGNYYHHILSPQTGYCYNNGLASVSIISDDSVDGDALSTVCFTLGLDQGLKMINGMNGVEAIFIDINNSIFYSDKAREYVLE